MVYDTKTASLGMYSVIEVMKMNTIKDFQLLAAFFSDATAKSEAVERAFE